MVDVLKHKIIYWFFVHVLLRRIGKRYPDFFKEWISDYVEKPRDREILILRYTGKDRLSFTAIAASLGVDESHLFQYHKRAVESLISAE